MVEYFFLPGSKIESKEITSIKANDMLISLSKNLLPFTKLVECRVHNQFEYLVIDIEPEIPQHCVNKILSMERFGILFLKNDQEPPIVIALRKDFPQVPHCNSISFGGPLVLCLTEEPLVEQLNKWTPSRFIKLLHRWLRLTARGELHDDEQPLEALFMGTKNRIILPSDLLQNEDINDIEIGIYHTNTTNNQLTYVAYTKSQIEKNKFNAPSMFNSFIFTTQPQEHKSTHLNPSTLKDLYHFIDKNSFLTQLRSHLKRVKDKDLRLLEKPFLFLVRIPKVRTSDGSIESIESWAFFTEINGQGIGNEIGLWEFFEGNLAYMFPTDETKAGENIKIEALIITQAFTPDMASSLNGKESTDKRHFISIGVGALGSQVLNNLIRSGIVNWTVVDDDVLLSHNLARHYLTGLSVGNSKVEEFARHMNTLFEEEYITAISDNILNRPLNLLTEKKVDAIIDMSASVAVGRYLANDNTINARRVSLFLNPSGTDLILLAEPEDRLIKLDCLEMEYYKMLIHQLELDEHFSNNGTQIRYSQACRDISSRLSQDQISFLAAIGSKNLPRVLDNPGATIKVWHSFSDSSVSGFQYSPSPYIEKLVGNWTLKISLELISSLSILRSGKLPKETGGVLIGSIDTKDNIVYVTDYIISPMDSIEKSSSYIRGKEGLPERLSKIQVLTGHQIEYIGEWHSHPKGSSVSPSSDDKKLFDWLLRKRAEDGLPALMAIVGDNDVNWIVRSLLDAE